MPDTTVSMNSRSKCSRMTASRKLVIGDNSCRSKSTTHEDLELWDCRREPKARLLRTAAAKEGIAMSRDEDRSTG
jgi:hypothetical protein